MADKEMYFWAIIPGEPHLDSLQRIKQQVSDEYKTYKALNSPPHITILPPIHLEEGALEKINSALEIACQQQQPFDIQLYGFGRFGQRTLFIQAELSDPLQSFYNKVKQVYEGEGLEIKHDNFTPHLTLANRDISRIQFKRAWESMKDKEYRLNFPAQALYCLKHNGQKWEIHKVFSFKDIQPRH